MVWTVASFIPQLYFHSYFISKLFCGYPEWHLLIALRYFPLRFLNCYIAVNPAFAQEIPEEKNAAIKRCLNNN